MVLDFYKLAEQPFGVTPDPRFIYSSPTHREAFASVLYGLSAGRGFTALIAMPGMGKTTLLFDFLEKLRNVCTTVFLFQSQCTPQGMLRNLLADLGVDDDSNDFVVMHRKLNECLLKESSRGRPLVVVVDEAQNLEEPVLEVVRMLSNFETPRAKLMHLILAGQPLLAEKLASPRLTQLRQRISIIARLDPLCAEETRLYIDHRLGVAGYDFAKPLFTKQAQAMIASYAAGIPRNINNVCFNAMSLGCVTKQRTIDADVIREVIGDLDLRPMYAESTRVPAFEVLQRSPANVSSQPRPRSRLRTWSARFALTIALLAIVSWPVFRVSRHISSALASFTSQIRKRLGGAHAKDAVPPVQKSSVSFFSTSSSPQLPDSSHVRVVADDLFHRMIGSFRTFGEYLRDLATIQRLNPLFSDPDDRRAVGVTHAATASSRSKTITPTLERVPAALSTGSEKQ
jgi:type II secretory pathway predicted ATPase ExeA